MNYRQLKKHNKKMINQQLNYLPYTIESKNFGGGYFIFSFEPASICHFTLKEFPDWKFAIWNQEKFSIFCDNIYMINKFKPGHGFINENSMQKFVEELDELRETLLGKDTHMRRYIEACDEAKKDQLQLDEFNRKNYQIILDELNKINSEQSDIELVLHDNCTKHLKVSPRYNIITKVTHEFNESSTIDQNNQLDFMNYKRLCDVILFDEEISILKDTYVFDSSVHLEVMNAAEYESRAIRYDYTLKTFDEKLDKILKDMDESSNK
ncbi:MAG: hypothetical protein WC136_01370 [Sphaerochaeta sp.]|jgi:hypothetical protein